MSARCERVPSTARAKATTTTNGATAQRRKTQLPMARFVRLQALVAGDMTAKLTATTGVTLTEVAGTTAEKLCQILQLQVQDRRDRLRNLQKNLNPAQGLQLTLSSVLTDREIIHIFSCLLGTKSLSL